MAHPVDIHVGNRVREARITKSMSQEQLGKHVGISFQQVQKYEKGANRIGGSRLWEISCALDVPIGYFFDGLGKGEGDHVVISRRTIELARKIDRIANGRIRDQILKLIKACSDSGDGI